MEYFLIVLKLFAATLLVIIAIYSWIYLSQVKRIENRFGLRLPKMISRFITVFTVLPIVISLIIIYWVLAELILT